ncbi:hypothetical protein IPG41_02120 [Candidatus Peregrinibacteria bacterium]|nr:MAG: hypothetical protein IPG41_02120 [Candidatus Peregrinibacteria bacterium]
MNIIARILQVVLGLWHLMGGIYESQNHQILLNKWALEAAPFFVWMSLGIVQIVLSVLLVVSLPKKLKTVAAVSAVGLALIDLFGIAIYSTYVGIGMLWAIIPAVVLIFIAYWRRTRSL